ncbi:uncharacterized protein I303_103135 [Kwoniella dejecticola CBS 10117]|uniref:Dolichyldiphosphatase n=1 Tax=Kwoniella dejecticola CBS 10117 TaxID=1296121 RepID=A0A1A6AAP4_9TREE|nr:dolichyldiphosphatase [Kwoniella dejecticola CBS 10117]OBR87131.1 dolichyldiphosphatase [Kwoniella dejecticola CBS 10117]
MTSLDPNKALLPPLPPLKSFSLTHILYDPTHPLSIPLTLLSLSPIFLFVSYFTLLIFNRRLSILFLGLGSVGNEVLSWILKRTLKGDRPYKGHGEIGTGYGNPSSHSQAAGFLVAWDIGYAMTLSIRATTTTPTRKSDQGTLGIIRKVRNGVYVVGLIVWSIGVSYSRWHLHYHTPTQIIAGYLVGLVAGSIYFYLTEYVPMRYPTSILGKLRRAIESIWTGLGGVGGFELGDAKGGWGEGWVFDGSLKSEAGTGSERSGAKKKMR